MSDVFDSDDEAEKSNAPSQDSQTQPTVNQHITDIFGDSDDEDDDANDKWANVGNEGKKNANMILAKLPKNFTLYRERQYFFREPI